MALIKNVFPINYGLISKFIHICLLRILEYDSI
jgi:hypothetical protein